MGKCAIVLANGDIEDSSITRTRLKAWSDAIVVAADGGHLHADNLGLKLHALVGDLDSISQKLVGDLLEKGIYIHSSPPQKDETDLELALLYAANQGADKILILGALGGRLDMTIANLLLMTHPKLVKIHTEMWHGPQTAWLIRPPGGKVHGRPGDTLSLIPLAGNAEGITTSHLVYPLKDEKLKSSLSRGLSNVLTDTTASIELREGILLAVHTPDRA